MNQRATYIRDKLKLSLAKDSSKPHRLKENPDGTIRVNISGVSAGLLYALAEETGESSDSILKRFDCR